MATELLVARNGSQTWSVLREEGRAVELRVEEKDDRPRAGEIYLARVVDVVPGLQADEA